MRYGHVAPPELGQGEKLPPGYSAQNVNTGIKAILGKFEIPLSQSYSPMALGEGHRENWKKKDLNGPS